MLTLFWKLFLLIWQKKSKIEEFRTSMELIVDNLWAKIKFYFTHTNLEQLRKTNGMWMLAVRGILTVNNIF